MLIKVKMPTIVGILTFISMINTTSERLKARNFFYLLVFKFLRAVEISCSVDLSMKKFYNLGAWFDPGRSVPLKPKKSVDGT